MAKMSDEPLSDETMGSIRGCANDALQVLADWKLYCAGCYAETLARHTRRGWCAGGPTPDG